MKSHWSSYPSTDTYDELVTENGRPRTAARRLVNYLQGLTGAEMSARRSASELVIREMGISFTLYTEGGNIDRAWPFDLIPRVIRNKEWQKVRVALIQRSKALNAFINDIYNQQKILADGVMPAEIVLDSGAGLPE